MVQTSLARSREVWTAASSTNYTAGALGPRTPTAGSGNERSRAKGRSSNMPNLGVRRT